MLCLFSFFTPVSLVPGLDYAAWCLLCGVRCRFAFMSSGYISSSQLRCCWQSNSWLDSLTANPVG